MLRRLVCSTALAVLALAPSARADGPQASPGLIQGWTGVTAPGTPFRYVTLPSGSRTVLAQIRRSTGRVWGFRSFDGIWGIPQVTNDGTPGGLSADRRVLVLAKWSARAFNARSHFLIVSTRSFRIWRRVSLQGAFAFDALSPGARFLYLIEHVSARDLTRYRVRAYDLATQRLLPRVIADRSQSGLTMHGYPVTRAASGDARWVYTLYEQSGGYPFVHALDTVHGSAVCIGIPWKGDQTILPTVRLGLDRAEGRLTIATQRGRALFAIDTRTYWVSRAGATALRR
jgi:hypothetical protein